MSKTRKSPKKSYKSSRRSAKNQRSTRRLKSSSFSNISSLTEPSGSVIPSISSLSISSPSSMSRSLSRKISKSMSKSRSKSSATSRNSRSKSRSYSSVKPVATISTIRLSSIPVDTEPSLLSEDLFDSIDEHGTNMVGRPETFLSSDTERSSAKRKRI